MTADYWPAGDPTHPYLWEGRNPLQIRVWGSGRTEGQEFLKRKTKMGKSTEFEYKGFVVRQVEYVPTPERAESHGMKTDVAYRVLDDITDEDALPFLQTWFWTPTEAISAIDLHLYLQSLGKRLTPSTSIFEYNQALRYRWRWGACYVALAKIQKTIEDAEMMGDDPTADIKKILGDMKAEVQSS